MKKVRKIQWIILMGICIFFLSQGGVYASTREQYSKSRVSNYPGYVELIENLKAEHPDWDFSILYTGLDWNTVIENEMAGVKNVVSITKVGSDWARDGGQTIESGSWIQASQKANKYYIDPRNMINEDYIFQFEDLSYNGQIQNVAGVQAIIKDITYMKGDKISYTDTNGNTKTINKSYAQVIMEAAEEAKISPYHLASRIRQEQGVNVSIEDRPLISGTVDDYVGYYNYLNINASGSTKQSVIINGLNHAKNSNWCNPEISIKEGAKFLANSYINKGQETLYLQKFDVDDGGTLYSHQYMQNISAATTESISVKNSYYNLGAIDAKINFVIPVYENMPSEKSQLPGYGEFVKVTESSVNIRSRNDLNNIIATVKKDNVLMRIARGEQNYGNYSMDRVIVGSVEGYIAGNFIQDIQYSKKSVGKYRVKSSSVNVRNEPTTNSKVLLTLVNGQILDINELNTWYNDGYYWSRATMADGRQIYLVTSYLEKYTHTYVPLSMPMNIDITQNYIQGENNIKVNVTCNNEFKNTKPTWDLSSDKKTYSKEYTEETNYETPFQDIYDNIKNGKIEVKFAKITEEYNSVSNKVTIKVTNENGYEDTKPSWTLSADKKTYSKVYDLNGKYTTPFIDKNGNYMNITFNVTKIDDVAPNITISQQYNASDNTVTVYASSNEELGEIKPSWTLSSDKMTYSKVYNLNGTYSTPFADKYGNLINKTFEVKQINVEFSVEKQYNSATNKVRVIAKSSIGFMEIKPTWNLSANKKEYSKEYDVNNIYTTPFTLADGSVKNPEIKITEIDDIAPEITISQEYNSSNHSVIINVKSNEILDEIKPTWDLSADKKIYSKKYTDIGEIHSTPFYDIYGNVVNVEFIVGMVVENEGKLGIKVKSEIGFKNTKSTWNLSADKKTYSKTYEEKGRYTTPFELQNGKIISLTFDL